MQLFVVDPVLTFEKKASIELEEDPSVWPRQILVELYKVLPEISDYTPEVKFLKIDEEKGYALGVIVVTNSTNSTLASVSASQVSAQKALIPVVVRNQKLSPLDVLVSVAGNMYPLSAQRLREVLYRPQTFELMTNDWSDGSIWNLFYPPGRSDASPGSGATNGMGAGGVQTIMGNGMKFAFAHDFELLKALNGTLLEPDVLAVGQRIELEPGLLKAAGANPALLAALKLVADMPVLNDKTAAAYEEALAQAAPAQVVQMGYSEIAEAYWVKTANRTQGVLLNKRMERGEFLKFAGSEITRRVDTEGTLTVSEEDPRVVVVATPSDGTLEIPTTYRENTMVYSATSGLPLMGAVFPTLIDGQGLRTPSMLFVNEKVRTVQDQIACAYGTGNTVDLPKDPPKGMGCFWTTGGPGSGEYGSRSATVPVKVMGSQLRDDGGVSYMCTELTGEQLKITLSPAARGVVAFPKDNELMLPQNSYFISLDNTKEEPLVHTGKIDHRDLKCASIRPTVTVVHLDADHYKFSYTAAPKLASAYESRPLGHEEAVFALCMSGHSGQSANDALNRADTFGSVSIPTVDLEGWDRAGIHKAASEQVKAVHALRHSLLKEAAALPDVVTVDSVLSLNFLNSENAKIFVSRLPYLEKALSMLCELVLASRVGLSAVPEGASARCARALDEVIVGLKGLALKEIRDVS